MHNPDNPKKSFDVYIDKDPRYYSQSITKQDVQATINKLEQLYKSNKYPQRIWWR